MKTYTAGHTDCSELRYAPGHSSFNRIERTCSFLTNKIVGVTLPDHIARKIPCASDNDGWMRVLDSATILCAKFWDKKYYSGFPISVETFLSDNPLVSPIKETHQMFKDFTNCSAKQLKDKAEFKQLQTLYTFLVKHANRKAYQLEFVRCTDIICAHCINLPKRENPFLEMINTFGGYCPTPKANSFRERHYKTF